MYKWKVTPMILLVFGLLLIGSLSAAQETKAPGIKVFMKDKRIEIDGVISTELERYLEELGGAIEYLACSRGGKEYESIIVLDAKPEDIYNALMKFGLKGGEAAYDDEETDKHILPTGEPVKLFVEWKNKAGKTKNIPAERLVRNVKAKRPLQYVNWVFTGSRWGYFDPESDDKVLMASITNNIVATHHMDPSVLFQNPLPEAVDDNIYKVNKKALPSAGTKIKFIIDVSNPQVQNYILISGHVQGVGFRNFTQKRAKGLGLTGYVKNLPNGKVEAVVEGHRFDVDALITQLYIGPPAADVTKVKVEKRSFSSKYKDFKVTR